MEIQVSGKWISALKFLGHEDNDNKGAKIEEIDDLRQKVERLNELSKGAEDLAVNLCEVIAKLTARVLILEDKVASHEKYHRGLTQR